MRRNSEVHKSLYGKPETKGTPVSKGLAGCYWYCSRGGGNTHFEKDKWLHAASFPNSGVLEAFVNSHSWKRILPLDSSLFRSWRFLLWSCLVDFIMGKTAAISLEDMGASVDSTWAAKEPSNWQRSWTRKEGSTDLFEAQFSRERKFSVGGCAAVPHIWNQNHQIGTGFNHLNHWKDYFEGEHLQSAYLLDLSVTTRITPFLGFGDPNLLRLTLPSTSWKHEALEDWWSAMRVCRCHSGCEDIWYLGTLGMLGFQIFVCDFMGHWDSNEKNMMWYGSFNKSSSRC